MSSSRYLPKCACQTQDGVDFEMRVQAVNVYGVMAALQQRATQGLCMESERYVAITLIATLVTGMACRPLSVADAVAGKIPEVDEAYFDGVLATLAADVRLRRAEMEAMQQAAADKGARQ